MKKVGILLLLALLYSCNNNDVPIIDNPSGLADSIVIIRSGWDFSLPNYVVPASNGTINIMKESKPWGLKGNVIKRYDVIWSAVEPQMGIYKFDEVAQAIKDMVQSEKLYGVELSVRGATARVEFPGTSRVEAGTAPSWVIAKYNLPEIPFEGSSSKVVGIPIWNQGYRTEYLKFIDALKKSGIPQMPEVKSCYVHAISNSRGEEVNMSYDDLVWCEQNTELTPTVFESTMRERFEAMAAAFANCEYKLMWVGDGADNFYKSVSSRLISYAYELGMGQRCGNIEKYLYRTTNSNLGQSVDTEGYLTVNEDVIPIKESRNFGDENEEYSPSDEDSFGPIEGFPYRYKESMLRALQMRRSTIWISGNSFKMDTALTNYVSLSLAKNVTNTPDAWVYLRESYLKPNTMGGIKPVKNFERWMYQRDKTGYKTVACEIMMLDKTLQSSGVIDPERRYNNTARRTDIASGNTKIGFAIDDRFTANYNGNIEIKVSYFDKGLGTISLNYKDKSNNLKSQTIECKNSSECKTVSFKLKNNYSFVAVNQDFDFEIEAKKTDAIISFVRIIKMTK